MMVEDMEVEDKEGKRDDKRGGGCKEQLTNSRLLAIVYTMLSILLV